MAFLPLSEERRFLSSGVSGWDPSMTARMRSAFSMEALALSMPICSTRLSVSRRPAVSMRTKGTPPILMDSSMVSLVVPGMSVTMARSSWRRAFRRLDFPAFGRPTMAVLRPSLIMRPSSDLWRRSARDFCMVTRPSSICSLVRSSRSSSG